MRVMMMHKSNSDMEAGVLPSQELLAGMGGLVGEMAKTGVFLAGEGLASTATGVRLAFASGVCTITRGPFAGTNELTAGITIVRTKSLDEAIEWASRLAAILGDASIDVRPLKEPWDLGVVPRPAGLETTRFMIIRKADAGTEAGALPTAAATIRLKKLGDEMTAAGVLLTSEQLQPSRTGLRLHYSGGVRTIVDGPFSESKELIAGFMLMRVSSARDAIDWTIPFAKLIGDVEIDLRPLYEPSDLA